MSKCTYSGKGFHPETSCMKNQIDTLTQLLEKQNIFLPKGAKKKEGGSSFEDKERVHGLKRTEDRLPLSLILDPQGTRFR